MSSYVYTVGSYVTLFGVGYLIYHISTQKGRQKALTLSRARTNQPRSLSDQRKEGKIQRVHAAEDVTTDAHDESALIATAKPPKIKSLAPPATKNVWLSNADDTSADDAAAVAAAAADNREFARQLVSMKEGKKFNTRTNMNGGSRQKSVKQSRATQLFDCDDDHDNVHPVSAPSSTNGADADDDQSSELSVNISPADANDVSGMMETQLIGSSVLKLTNTDAHPNSETKSVRDTQSTEPTKKQRQNKKKTDAARAARESAELERKKKLEASRRVARVSEGRPAPDGSAYMARVNSDKHSAWETSRKPNEGPKSAENVEIPFLDTGKHINGHVSPSPAIAPVPKGAAVTSSLGGANNWMTSLPSEEEQMEMIKDKDESWSTVKAKSSKKLSRKDAQISGAEDNAQPSAKAKAVASTIATERLLKQNNSYGSFSALSANKTSAQGDEEEWEV